MKLNSLLQGMALGALTMYFFDPDRGRRRRADVRDRARSRARRLQRDFGVMTRDFAHRVQGMQHVASKLWANEAVSDLTLTERLRSNLGRCVSNPGAITIEATDGHVALRGDILDEEIEETIRCLRRHAGGRRLINELRGHSRRENFAGLRGVPHEERRAHWTPSTSLIACSFGGIVTLMGMGRRGIVGALMSLTGLATITHALTEVERRHNGGLRRLASAHPKKSEERKALPS